ncbi:protein ITPRID1 isoform X2 [Labrus mixtus]|uniref:protein ITPRID1 isoform X2 n=1 Tax=Labrus mixtus TaxID=508554 RepID=UPI0029C0E864|nr:protein ITPRID1 isoform X2 [Labrus mixtus]
MWTRSSPAISRWNSFNSTLSDYSGPLSVMDILNLWNDDPEEVLLDLGFGCDEPDLSGRIPARFINYQSQARGINLQVFLEAQKNRLDLENPDVSNRFRQLEVLQQVTTAFSSLVGSSSSLRASQEKDLPPEARERRRRIGLIFRQASKKTLSHIKNKKTQDLTTSHVTSPLAAPESHYPPSSLGDNRIPLKRVKTGFLETMSPLAEEQGTGPDAQSHPQVAALIAQDGAFRSLKEGRPLTGNPFLQRKKSPGQVRESFEMEEIHSFDESITGIFTGGAEHLVRCVVRTNSCQSDSSGFLEEPFIPSQSLQESPAPDLIKALSCLSGGSTDSSSERPRTPSSPQSSPTSLLPSSLTSFSPEQSFISGPSQSPALLCDPKSDLDNSDTLTPPDQTQCPPASLAASEYEYLSPCFSSPELQDTNDQSETPPPASFTPVPSSSSPMKADSIVNESEEIKMEEKDSPSPSLSILYHDSDPTACSSVTPPVSSTYSPNLDFVFNSINSSSGGPGDAQSRQTEEYFHQNSLSASDGSSSQLPSDPFLPSSAPSEIHWASSEASSSQSPENNQNDTLLRDSWEKGPCDPPSYTQTKEEEAPSCHIFQSDQDRPLYPPDLFLDSSRFEEFNQQPSLTPDPSVPICESTLSSKPHFEVSLIDPTIGGMADSTEQTIYQQEGQHCFDDDGHIAVACPAQDVIPAKMDYLSLDLEDTLLRNERDERGDDRHSDTVQTPETVVYISHTESSAGLSEGSRLVDKEEEGDPQVLSGSLHGELSTEKKPEELRQFYQIDINGTESESPRTSLRFHGEVPETNTRNEIQPKSLFEIESLDVAFQTSVDGSDGESGDLDAYFQQLDNERQVYWAEPIQISNQSSLLEESGSFEASDGSPGNSLLTRGAAILDSLLATGKVMSSLMSSSTMYTAPANPEPKPLSRSVSVQMSSSPSSHIIHRKDVPFMTDSKCSTLLPTVVPLDTSTPFRAVQSWTDWQIQKNNLSKMLSHGAPDNIQNAAGVSETIQRPTLIFSSSPSLPLLSYDGQSYDCFPGMARENSTVSVSLDKGLWSDEEEEVERNGYEDEKNLWEGNHTATMACCFSCDHQGTCDYNKQHTVGNIPYSLDELEEMMLSLQQFRYVLCSMEEQLSEDQAAVYRDLSDQDREKVRDIEELRQAVKKEAGELEMHLNELAHHYDDSLKMKMHRLLDEQSLLCTQLRVSVPGKVSPSPCPASNRTVATQCCLMPWMPSMDVSSWSVDSHRQSPPGSESIREGLSCSPTKADKVDILSFLQKLKESLRHSVNTDSLE